MAQKKRRTFTVEIYEDTGEVARVVPPADADVKTGRLPTQPIKATNITNIVIPLEILKNGAARTCVHSRDCRYWCW